MNRFFIKDIEALTGIKAHTLRVWEQRYDFFSPKRTETNIRYYDDSDLRLLLNISILNEHGQKISDIAKMCPTDIAQNAANYFQDCANYGCQIQALCDAMFRLDEALFEKTMSANILKQGFVNTMHNVVFPFLRKIGVMWQTGSISPANEHFITHLIKQKIIIAIDGLHLNTDLPSKRYILFLPEGESHEIGLLFANYLIKMYNHNVLYLGANLPLKDLEETVAYYKPNGVLTVLTNNSMAGDAKKLILRIKEKLPHWELLVGGPAILNLNLENVPNIIHLKSMDDLSAQINRTEVTMAA